MLAGPDIAGESAAEADHACVGRFRSDRGLAKLPYCSRVL